MKASDDGRAWTRRAFLGAAVAGLSATTGRAAARPGGRVRTGSYLVGCYTRPWDRHELSRALEGVAEVGYAHVGLMTAKGTTGATGAVVTPATTEAEALQIAGLVRERGLKVCSVYGAFSVQSSLAEGIRQLKSLIRNVAVCGGPELLLGGTGDAALYDPYFKALQECCGYADEQNVGLTLKPHGGLNATGQQCREAIERVAKPNFRLWYDPGNILYYSDGALDPLEDVVAVDGLVVGLSVKDFRPPKDVNVTPGTGQVNFPVVFARLRMGGFTRGQLVVETTAPGDFAQVTAEARKARLFVEGLTRGGMMDAARPPEK